MYEKNVLTIKFVLLWNSVVVGDHEHDGNELQVTQGFRTHVAKKLGHFLDRLVILTFLMKHVKWFIVFCGVKMHIFFRCIDTLYVTVSYITELQAETSSRVESAKCDDDDDEGKASLSYGIYHHFSQSSSFNSLNARLVTCFSFC